MGLCYASFKIICEPCVNMSSMIPASLHHESTDIARPDRKPDQRRLRTGTSRYPTRVGHSFWRIRSMHV
ncbi:hypothetical protein RRG08_006852 [Elysia crispata]|uniref:Uncharacterized protein n=1 Tax=Elysia crispata TaxID=231223 RepID=A0AAE0XV58_9GAST|nr:hypothetical protein RRG08_006852 [Elysia crispata]